MTIPIAPNEKERLEALKSYEILDTEPEEAFDHFTSLAAQYFDAPMAVISLIDDSRQWFKSRVGLGIDETPREISFCTHAIMHDEIMVVSDATKDDRFSSNPFVVNDPNIRFYAGAPLIDRDGFRLGTLCTFDSKPHEVTDKQTKILESLAKLVIEQFEIRKTNRLLQVQSIELEVARQNADEANRAKTEFLSSMSHELRTPMNAILGFGQLLEQMPGETLSKNQLDYTHQILRSGNHLLELIDQVLELSKIEAGQINLNLESISPLAVIEACIKMIAGKATQQEIKIINNSNSIEIPLLRTDSRRLSQVILNLLSNAIKYNFSGGTITIECENGTDGFVYISITDTGRGIPNSKKDNIFEPFNRLGLESSEIEGTGIGLTISKQIMDVLGGTISFTSEENVGSTFSLKLPISNGEMETLSPQEFINEENEALSSNSSAKFTVLYVEDNPPNLLLMEEVIKRLPDFTMISAPNAEIAIHLARENQPNLILMDINLPGMDGIQALKELQQYEETKDIPAIALTAAAMPHEKERGIQAGFKDYITKPINVSEIMNAVKIHSK